MGNAYMTEAEYIDALQGLYEEAAAKNYPPEKTAELEFRMTVHFKLGADFSESRIDGLWEIQREFNKVRDGMAAPIRRGILPLLAINIRLAFLFRKMRKRYSTVLSDDEVKKLLGA